MLVDAHGRGIRRAIGFFVEYVLDEPRREGDICLVAQERVELEEEYFAQEECRK